MIKKLLAMKHIQIGFVLVALIMGLNAHPAMALTIDLTSGTSGTTPGSQSFNETRGVDVTVLGSSDLFLSSMTLSGLDVNTDSTLVGARVYESSTGDLIASSDITVSTGYPLAVTVPISAALEAGNSYRLAFYLDDSSYGDMFKPYAFPYVEATGTLEINQAYAIWTDSFPTNPNIFVPFITIQTGPGTIPTANFSASPTSGPAPLTVNFSDESTNNITEWFWDFGDGFTSYEQHNSHTYHSIGSYDVSLTVSNVAGSDTKTKIDYITVISEAPDLIARCRAFYSLDFGERITVMLLVENIGNERTDGFRIGMYLSDDGINLGELLDEATIRIGLRAGHARPAILRHVAPDSLSGKYVICVIDSENFVIESNETNNRKIVLIP